MPALRVSAAFMALSAGTVTTAQTITFEGQANTIYTSPITRSGFVIGNTADSFVEHFHEIDSTGFSLTSNGTGVLLNDVDTKIFLEAVGGGPFSLASFDIATSGPSNNGGLSFIATGYLNNLVVGTTTGALTNQFVTFSGFANVDRIVFDGAGVVGGQGGGFELDNFVLNSTITAAVPEPSTWAMMLIGFGAIGASMRRRRLTAIAQMA